MAVTREQLLADSTNGARLLSRDEQAERAVAPSWLLDGSRQHRRPAVAARCKSVRQWFSRTCAAPDGAFRCSVPRPNPSLRRR